MKNLTSAILAAAAAASMLGGCSAQALTAALNAATKAEGAANGAQQPAGQPPVAGQPPAQPGQPPLAGQPPTQPGQPPAPQPPVSGAPAVDLKPFMDAVDKAAAQDPEMVARLLITGLVHYDQDKKLGRAMMAYTMRGGIVSEVPSSPTGVEPQVADEIYFRTLDRNTKLGSYYLDAPASAALPWDQMAAKVVIDKEYKAIDQGLSEDGKMWTFYMKVTGAPTEVRPRPVRVQQDGERGWRVSNYSSIMVQP